MGAKKPSHGSPPAAGVLVPPRACSYPRGRARTPAGVRWEEDRYFPAPETHSRRRHGPRKDVMWVTILVHLLCFLFSPLLCSFLPCFILFSILYYIISISFWASICLWYSLFLRLLLLLLSFLSYSSFTSMYQYLPSSYLFSSLFSSFFTPSISPSPLPLSPRQAQINHSLYYLLIDVKDKCDRASSLDSCVLIIKIYELINP